MPRVAKQVMEARAAQKVRVNKAKESILEQFGKLLDKHLPNIIKPETAAEGMLSLKIAETGKASMRLTYQCTMSEGAAFELDDGQADLPLDPSGAGEPGDDKDKTGPE